MVVNIKMVVLMTADCHDLASSTQPFLTTCCTRLQKRKTGLKRSGPSGSVDPEDRPVQKTKKRKAESAGTSFGAPGPSRIKDEVEEEDEEAAQAEEDSEPEGSEVSYDSDEPPQAEESEADSDEGESLRHIRQYTF